IEKATRLVDQQKKHGYFSKCHYASEKGLSIEIFHNPLEEIITEYPATVHAEQQMIEDLLRSKIQRRVKVIDKELSVVVYSLHTL
ncbi:hypothetical protein OAB00_03925, partial [Akkermansiaceae bacterium]|nr:hypothetical protein [Akkermansiaceae bacterium]